MDIPLMSIGHIQINKSLYIGTIHLVRTQSGGRGFVQIHTFAYFGEGGICSYIRKKENYTATKTKKQQNYLPLESKLCKICFTKQIINKCDTWIICVTNSTRKICKIPARKNLSKFGNNVRMTLE